MHRQHKDEAYERGFDTKGVFPRSLGGTSDSSRTGIEDKTRALPTGSIDSSWKGQRKDWTGWLRFDHLEWTAREWQLRQLGTVATLRGVLWLSLISFLSDRWTMMMMTRVTEWPSGRGDHDRVTGWSKWPRPLFRPIRTRVYIWMASRLVWKKCLSFTFYLAQGEVFPPNSDKNCQFSTSISAQNGFRMCSLAS